MSTERLLLRCYRGHLAEKGNEKRKEKCVYTRCVAMDGRTGREGMRERENERFGERQKRDRDERQKEREKESEGRERGGEEG